MTSGPEEDRPPPTTTQGQAEPVVAAAIPKDDGYRPFKTESEIKREAEQAKRREEEAEKENRRSKARSNDEAEDDETEDGEAGDDETGGTRNTIEEFDTIKKRQDERKLYPPERKTDLGNARRLVRLHSVDLKYVHAWRGWLVWESGRWRRDDNGAVVRLAKAVVEGMFVEASRINDEARRTAARNYALKSQNAARLTAMVALAESESRVVLSVDKLDADPYLLGVPNGVIDLRTVTFREARREDYVTKIAGAAFDESARCPNWIAFLENILAKEVIEYLQRAVGYTLTGLTNEEVMFILWGGGSNGKTTFRETIFELIGQYAMSADASLLVTNKRQGGATPDLARLHGRRLVTINETEQNDLLNKSRVKYITGTDTISARDLYEKKFDFTPMHKTWLTTNHKLIVRGTDDGIWRRIHQLPFTKKIENGDKFFRANKLIPELPGILNWALDGLRSYWRDGLKPPKAVLDATSEYRDDMDLIGNWIDERCIEDTKAEMRTSVLHKDYEDWAQHEIGFAVSTIAFGRELNARGYAKAKVNRGRGVRGLRLRFDNESQGEMALTANGKGKGRADPAF